MAGGLYPTNLMARKRLGINRHGCIDAVFNPMAFYWCQYSFADLARRVSHAFTLEFPSPDAWAELGILSRRVCRAGVGKSDANCFGGARHGDDHGRHGGVCDCVFHHIGHYFGGIGFMAVVAIYCMDNCFWHHHESVDSQIGSYRATTSRCPLADVGARYRCLF